MSSNSNNKKIDTDSPYKTPISVPQNYHSNNVKNMHNDNNNTNNDNFEEQPQTNNISQNYLILNQLNQKQQRLQQQRLLLQQQKQQEKLQQQNQYSNNDQLEYNNSTNYIINCTTQFPKSEFITQIDNSNNLYNNLNTKNHQKIKPSYIQSVYEMDQKLLQKVRLFQYFINYPLLSYCLCGINLNN